ncbi:ethylmalonyl-CoA decarboxylase isoform X3 [Numida meleagris]|uniref:ethylmalonyl-CoA decarboxylase isoform X3 n=1 Tax=Numida meleagris TaxID=8996 RepID=UPI000B3E10D4|nr:ethylmalonyl-CoA decarboxylase isoform X3 [Numida meleagris]
MPPLAHLQLGDLWCYSVRNCRPLRLCSARSWEMVVLLWKNLFHTTKGRILQQRWASLYNGTHDYDEELIKKKLQQFAGGSIDLSKEHCGIGILTLNNSQLMNAFTGTMMLELQERVTELENWKDGKGLIIRGAGKTFCSGSDLNAVKAISNSKDGMNMCMFMQNTLTRLMRLPLISIALVQGKALGGGAELTTACDFRCQSLSQIFEKVSLPFYISAAERRRGRKSEYGCYWSKCLLPESQTHAARTHHQHWDLLCHLR